MRVLIATPLYPPEIGGPATFTKILEDELPRRGVSVSVSKFSDVMHFPKVIRHIAYFIRVYNAAHDHDLILALDPVSTGLPAAIAARFAQKKFLVRIVGDRAWEEGVSGYGVNVPMDLFAKKFFGRPRLMAMKLVQIFVARMAQKVVVPSEFLRVVVSNWGVAKEKIVLVHNSFESEGDLPTYSEAREKLRVTGKVIFSAGRLVSWKGFETLVGLIPDLMDKIPGLTLWIAGEGPLLPRLEGQSMNLQIEERVKFLGRLSRKDLFDRLAASDVFVLNTFYEGFSHQILEAMALGAPVVTTTAGGNPELVTHEKEGILVSYDDAGGLKEGIIRVLTDESFAERCREMARIKAESFTKERTVNELIPYLS